MGLFGGFSSASNQRSCGSVSVRPAKDLSRDIDIAMRLLPDSIHLLVPGSGHQLMNGAPDAAARIISAAMLSAHSFWMILRSRLVE